MITATSIALYLLGGFFLFTGAWGAFYGVKHYKNDGRYDEGPHPLHVMALLCVAAVVLTMAAILWSIA